MIFKFSVSTSSKFACCWSCVSLTKSVKPPQVLTSSLKQYGSCVCAVVVEKKMNQHGKFKKNEMVAFQKNDTYISSTFGRFLLVGDELPRIPSVI
jgi:hypothetical protein